MSFLLDYVTGASATKTSQDPTITALKNVQAELIKVTIVAQERLGRIQELEERLKQAEAENQALKAALADKNRQEEQFLKFAQNLDQQLSTQPQSELQES